MPHPVNIANLYRFWEAAGKPETIDLNALSSELSDDETATAKAPPPKPPTAPPRPKVVPTDLGQVDGLTLGALQEQVAALQQQLSSERDQRNLEAERDRTRTFKAEAAAFADGEIRLGHATPAERIDLVNAYAQAAKDDYASPTQVAFVDPRDRTSKLGSRVDALRALYAKRSPHTLNHEYIGSNPDERSAAYNDPNRLSTLAVDGTDPEDTGDRMAKAATEYGKRMNGRGAK